MPSLRSTKHTAPSYKGSLHYSVTPPAECTLWDINPFRVECTHKDMCGLVSPDSTFPHFLHSVPKFHFFLQFLVGKGMLKHSHSSHCHSPHTPPHITSPTPHHITSPTPHHITSHTPPHITSPTMVSCVNSSAHCLAKLSGSCFRTCPSKMEVCPVLSSFTKFINYAARHILIVLYHNPSNTINYAARHILIVLYHSPSNTIKLCSKAYRCNTLTQLKWLYKWYMCSKNTLNWSWADMKQSPLSTEANTSRRRQ